MSKKVLTTCRHPHRNAWLLIALLGVNSAHAVTKGPTEDSLWYYEIGGAEPVSASQIIFFMSQFS